MLDRRKSRHRITLGADKAYDVEAFVSDLRARSVTPHITVNGAVSKHGIVRTTAIDARTTRHPGYAVSQRCRKRIEEVFAWTKTIAGLRKTRHRGARPGAMVVHLRRHRLQPDPIAEALRVSGGEDGLIEDRVQAALPCAPSARLGPESPARQKTLPTAFLQQPARTTPKAGMGCCKWYVRCVLSRCSIGTSGAS